MKIYKIVRLCEIIKLGKISNKIVSYWLGQERLRAHEAYARKRNGEMRDQVVVMDFAVK